MEAEGDVITMHWLPRSRSPALLRPLNDSIMACWLYFGRLITGLKIYPSAVGFCHPEPIDISDYQRLFNCPITFSNDSNSMTIPIHLLSTPLLESDPELKVLMLDEMNKLDHNQSGYGLPELVETWLLQHMGKRDVNSVELSNHFHMSERTIRRALKKEGVHLRHIKQIARLEKAQYWLAETNTPISDIACMLGYKNNSCFSQAYKSWTDESPSSYRKRQANVK